jgi:hypothetical protein
VTDQKNMPVVSAPTEQQVTEQEKKEPDRSPPPPPESDAQRFEQLIRRFSRPASQITGRIVSLFGLMLIVATLVLGIIHMLVTVDFSTAIIAGAALSIAGIWTIATEDAETRRTAEREWVRLHADDVADAINRRPGTPEK